MRLNPAKTAFRLFAGFGVWRSASRLQVRAFGLPWVVVVLFWVGVRAKSPIPGLPIACSDWYRRMPQSS